MTRDEINREIKDFREALSHHAFDHLSTPTHTRTFSLSREGAEHIRRLLDMTDKPTKAVTIHGVVAKFAEIAESEDAPHLMWMSSGAAGCLVQGERLRQRLNAFKTATVKQALTDRLEQARDEPGCSMVPLMPAEALALLCLATGAESASRMKIDPANTEAFLYLGQDSMGQHLYKDHDGTTFTGPPLREKLSPGVKLPPAAEDQAMLNNALAELDRERNLLNAALRLIEALVEDRGTER